MADLPRFRSPLDRWPNAGDPLPAPLPGPHGQALALLAQVCPSLTDERRDELAPHLTPVPGTNTWTRAYIVHVLLRFAPELFEEPDHG